MAEDDECRRTAATAPSTTSTWLPKVMLLDIVHALLAESLTKTGCGICDQAAWRSTAQAKEDEGEETRTPQRGLAHVKLLLVIVAGR